MEWGLTAFWLRADDGDGVQLGSNFFLDHWEAGARGVTQRPRSRARHAWICADPSRNASGGCGGHTLDHMVVPVHGSRERLLDGGACEVDTEALLAMVLQGATVDREALADIARHIDGDWPGIGYRLPRPRGTPGRRQHHTVSCAGARPARRGAPSAGGDPRAGRRSRDRVPRDSAVCGVSGCSWLSATPPTGPCRPSSSATARSTVR